MPSARRTGTNESISTYGAGLDYTALNTWEAATDNDNVTGTVSPVLQCAAAQYDDNMFASGGTNNATYRRIVRPNSSSFHTGIRDTGVRFYNTLNANTLAANENELHIQDIQSRVTCNSGSDRGAITCTTVAGGTTYYVGCIATNSQNAGAGANQGFFQQAAGTMVCVDCLGDNNEGHQFRMTTGTPYDYNCTAIGGTHGFIQTGGTAVAKNCLAHGTSTADFNGTITKTNCASEDATADGTGARASQTFTFVNAGANNYHLATTDAGAKGFGADLSADGTYAFDDDIDRQTRAAPWDIGFDEIPSNASFVKSIFLNQSVNRASSY